MDEYNHTDQENGFVMRDNPATEPEPASQAVNDTEPAPEPQHADAEPVQQESAQDSTYRWSASGQSDGGRWGNPRQEQQSGQAQGQPQPMPSDNTYRFQNVQEPPKKKAKTGLSMPKTIAGAVVFGVVAALCFAGVTAVVHLFSGGGNGISQNSIGTTKDNSPVAVVSGAAATPYDVSGIVEQVMPSIVAITEKSTQTSYFGQTYSSTGAGSGFIVKQDNDQLLIVTNNHVVAGADKISVQFNDGEVADATVKGTSEANDLAVITVDLAKLKDSTKKSIRVATLGSSDDAKVGQMVIAIGNALGYGQSVTVGYVSAKNREVATSDGNSKSTTQVLMQTDAAINPGNSGGALIDTNGNVIGINSSKYMSYGSTNVEGMGYAIPMSDAVPVINELMDRQVLKDDERGYLGITGRSISDSVSESYGIPMGVYVVSVSESGAAYKAGIKKGDVITQINGRTVKTIDAVQEIVNNSKAGTDIELTIKRSNNGEYQEKKVTVTLKNKDTLEGLEEDGTQDGSGFGDGYGDGGYNQDGGSQVIPWGGGY